MIDVYCFSGCGHSMQAAAFFKERLHSEIIPIEKYTAQGSGDTAVVVFPVYCQNIPAPVASFLKELKAKYAVFVALYGGISYGKVLYEAQKLFGGTVIAGAYLPSGHSYKNQPFLSDTNNLPPLLEKLSSKREVILPKTPKNIFSDLAPAFRSRLGVSLRRSADCDGCNICGKRCPMGAIENGVPNRRCIRCLRCVSACPKKALSFKLRSVMRLYLSRRPNPEWKLYI